MTVTAQIAAGRVPGALLVPSQALRFQPRGIARPDGVDPQVWILDGGLPRAIPVELRGANDTHSAIVGPGLPPGRR
jgi:multidrug efflux pump subunit AcrA (membrane-fusion protein)